MEIKGPSREAEEMGLFQNSGGRIALDRRGIVLLLKQVRRKRK